MNTDVVIPDSGLADTYKDIILLEVGLRGIPKPDQVYHSDIRKGECIIWQLKDTYIEIFLSERGFYDVTGLAGDECKFWGRFEFEYWEGSRDLRMPSIAVCILKQLLECEEVEG